MKLSRVNTLLLVGIILVNGYIIAAPLAPMLTFWIQRHATNQLEQLADQLHLPVSKTPYQPGDNRIIIPSMLLNAPINEGPNLRAARSGTWHRPHTGSPERGGNTVVVAHRFTYTNPRGTFYYLDKVKVGDEIGVFWSGKRYLYKVSEVKTVPPTDTAIEAATGRPQLTLYTCTPLWLPKDRLVVIAKPEERT
jgi:LPXTG-site transpeptidase (sortase) family protein